MDNEIKKEKTIYELLQEVRYELSKTPLKKSGHNAHLKFNYFELADFVPTATKLFNERGLCPIFNITYSPEGVEMATLKLIKGPDEIVFVTPTAEPSMNSPIQSLGAKHTYLRRYLYLNLLDLTESDIVDLTTEAKEEKPTAVTKAATAKQIEMIRGLYDEENIAKMLEYYQINSLEELNIKQASEVIANKKEKNNGQK
ncbi:MAG: ERF family protein [Firmicutes bacterium]|nr:ERF family protein [Candidatus Colivicinus equi]